MEVVHLVDASEHQRDYRSKTKPYKHQWREFVENRKLRKRAMAWSMRTGKTKTIFDLADYLHREREIECLIIIAPDGVQTNWIKREMPVHYAGKADTFIYNPSAAGNQGYKARFNQWMIHKVYSGRLQIFAIGSDSIRTENGRKYLTEMIRARQGRVLLVADECHMFGSPSSARGRVIRALGKACNWVRIMSGSIGGNTPMRIWGQYEIIEPGALGYKTHGAFKQAYADEVTRRTKDGRTFQEISNFKNLEDLAMRQAKWTSIVRREDCDDMPTLNRIRRVVAMTDKQKRLYKKVEKESLLDEYEVSGAGLLGKLAQIAGGWYYDEHSVAHDVEPPEDNPLLQAIIAEITGGREKATKEDGPQLKENGKPKKYIVWANYTHDLELLSAALKKRDIPHVTYFGTGMSKQEKQASIDAFMNNPEIIVFIGQPKSGGIGLDLSAADAILWMSHTFDIVVREQADERATKVGGKTIDIIDFEVEGTVFGYILSAQLHKIDIREQVAGLGLKAIIEIIGLL